MAVSQRPPVPALTRLCSLPPVRTLLILCARSRFRAENSPLLYARLLWSCFVQKTAFCCTRGSCGVVSCRKRPSAVREATARPFRTGNPGFAVPLCGLARFRTADALFPYQMGVLSGRARLGPVSGAFCPGANRSRLSGIRDTGLGGRPR